MMSFRNGKLVRMDFPAHIVYLLEKINKFQEKQNLYIHQYETCIDNLVDQSINKSLEAFNTFNNNYAKLMEKKENKKISAERSKAELAGYKKVLNIINTKHDIIEVNSSSIKKLHQVLYYRDFGAFLYVEAGQFKSSDTIINGYRADGEKYEKFRPLSADKTAAAMDELCTYLNEELEKKSIDPLITIGAFIFDFHCIHPFIDGNGRMTRLLTLLLLYKMNYMVGKYVSLEKIIKDSHLSYDDALEKSSAGWHEGEHDILYWLEYFFHTILTAYQELDIKISLRDWIN